MFFFVDFFFTFERIDLFVVYGEFIAIRFHNGLILTLRNQGDQVSRRLFQLDAGKGIAGRAEESVEAIVVLRGNRVEFMIVASCTTNGEAEK